MRKVFALEDDIRVVAQVETLANLYAALQRFHQTWCSHRRRSSSPGPSDAIPELVRRAPEPRSLCRSRETDESNTVELYRRGVRGVVPRSISPDLLIKCVRKIAEGETWIDNQSINWVIEAYRAQATTLTNPRTQPSSRRRSWRSSAASPAACATRRSPTRSARTEQVIKNYLRKIYDKLGVSDRLELALYCLHHELLKKYEQELEAALFRLNRRLLSHCAPRCKAGNSEQERPGNVALWYFRLTVRSVPVVYCLSISTSMENLTSYP